MSIAFIVLILFIILHPVIGWINRRKSEDIRSFVLAGREVSPLSAAASLVATIMGASAILGTTGLAQKHGPSAFVWLGAGILGLTVLIFLIDRVDFRKALSLPDMLGKHGGAGVRIASALVIIPTWIGIVAAQFAAVGKVAEAVQPGSYLPVVVVVAICVAAYVALSGQRGVLKTDKFQIVLIFILLLTLVVWMLATGLDVEKLNYQPLGSLKMVDIAIAVAFPFLIGPDIFSRLLTVKTASLRKRTLLYTIVGLLFISAMVIFVGTFAGLFVDFSAKEQLMVKLPEIFWGNIGVTVASVALLAAIISSADTCLFTSATIISVDLLGKSNAKTIAFLSVVMAIISAILALWLGGVLKALFISYTIYTSGLAVPAIFALFLKKALPKYTMIVTIVAGSTIGMIGRFNEQEFTLLFAITVSLLIAVVGNLIENNKNAFGNNK